TLTGAKPVLKTSDHFFFKLSEPKCVRFLEEWLGAAGRLQPQVVNKAREWLTGKGDQALGDWDISRDAPYFGIPIPDAPGKYFYVWLDAPIGYLAALKSYFALGKAQANGEPRSFEAFLAAPDTEQIHFIGKDIIYFHTLFWPAMLKFAGAPYRVPNHVYVHGFITVSGEKMSKSRGTGISPLRYLDLGMNAEWLRYYIAAKLNANVEDIDFNPDDFVARVNSDLVGKYVNIASRIAPFLLKFFGNRMPPLAMTQIAGVPVEAVGCLTFALQQSKLVRTALEEREFGKAIRLTMEVADVVNAEIDGYKPWLLAKDAATNEQSRQKLGKICAASIAAFKALTLFLKPIVPALAADAEAYLRDQPLQWDSLDLRLGVEGFLPAGHEFGIFKPLITRVDPKQLDALFESDAQPGPGSVTAGAAAVSIDEFKRIDLRVAKILDAQHVDGADKVAALASLLGRPALPLNPANGVEGPPLVAQIDEEVCIGCAKCLPPCPVDAIVGAHHQMHTVVLALCTGCELCVAPCPVDCISMVPRSALADAPEPPAAHGNRERFGAHNARIAARERERAALVAERKRTADGV